LKVVAIIQARISSTRLPGKVMLDLAGEPLLTRVINRVQRAKTLNQLIVATTTEPADRAIIELAATRSWAYFLGRENDVLDRYYQAAIQHQANVVVRITSDCPLIEPEIIDRVVKEFFERQPELDYASNVLPRRTFPRGLDTEVIRFEALEKAWREDNNPEWREHVTPYIYYHPEKFRIHNVVNNKDYSSFRWTVDTPEDLAFVRQIYDYFGQDYFSWMDVLHVLEKYPEWQEINRCVEQKVI